MKKLIIICFSILCGVYLFGRILGDEEDTLKTVTGNMMQNQIENLKSIP